MKMPIKVWKEVVKLQRNFLWGGLLIFEEKNKLGEVGGYL
jgi:hypothetical protein